MWLEREVGLASCGPRVTLMGGAVSGLPGALFGGLDRSASAALLTWAPVHGQLYFATERTERSDLEISTFLRPVKSITKPLRLYI